MGSSAQLYSLSWGEFSTSLTSAVQLLRGHGDLVDVTLAAGGRTYPAHKIVLSAASPFLLNLLKSTPCEHPVVLLAGVSSDDLESLLEFVYKGEVSVEPSQLPSLLQAAHCLGIHGLASPTILTENGEEVPPTAIPTVTEPVTREIMNSSIPINRRKKRRRKSSSSSGKWAKIDTATDNEDRHDGHGEDDRTTDCDPKNEETSVNADDANEKSKFSNHRTTNDWITSTGAHIPSSLTVTEVQTALTADNFTDIKPSLQTLMAMQQQYSPLHIPTFSGSLSMALPGFPLPTTSSSTLKVRGASDCPGICPLCGATLRQARNLRRHLLSSCKYRLNSFHTLQQSTDHVVVDIEPKIEIGAFSGQNHGNDSGENGHSKGKSVSDQPTKCPLCGAILRQSRNLRRHLELLHFGAGNNNKPSVRIRRRKHDFQSPTMVPRIHQSQLRTVITNDNSDFSSLNPLSLTSTVNSLSSNFPGNILTPGSEVHPRSEPITAANPLILGPPNNGLYSSENSATSLNLVPLIAKDNG
ncbi:hypothetical protein G9C98_001449 [Cotesia typhae]|uniref:Transcription factor GAGA n=1 Tax=Cotesia typhae TaxID=2053667 RepID=A0A8J5V7Q8_9HYME|nr:hypothetical protein G9C98_001449 [Cotesia typhae]